MRSRRRHKRAHSIFFMLENTNEHLVDHGIRRSRDFSVNSHRGDLTMVALTCFQYLVFSLSNFPRGHPNDHAETS